jgi:serralysin
VVEVENMLSRFIQPTIIRGVQAVMLLAAATSVTSSQRLAHAFVPAARWASTASGPTGLRDDPITLTWSLVPDASPIPDRQPSTLIAFLDGQFGVGAGGDDLAMRPWFPLIDSAFSRWSALGGVQFVYEPNDDGAPQYSTSGVLGVRGDVRLAAAPGDGPGRTLASSQYPDAGDVVLDADEAFRFANPDGNYLRLRNTLMHEIGHALGFDHVASSDAKFLMEGALDVSFDGPQLDEIRGLHFLYGDRMERANSGAGNDVPSLAIPAGLLTVKNAFVVGGDAGSDAFVAPSDADFLSISNRSDVDCFSFEISSPMWLDVELIPCGGQFRQGEIGSPEVLIDANASSDLSFAILASNQDQLALVNSNSRGEAETLDGFYLPAAGEYVIRVSGSREAVQLYELRLSVNDVHAPEPSSATLAIAMVGMLLAFQRSSSCKRYSMHESTRTGAGCEARALTVAVHGRSD